LECKFDAPAARNSTGQPEPDRSSKFPNERDFAGARPSSIGFGAKDHPCLSCPGCSLHLRQPRLLFPLNGASAKAKQARPTASGSEKRPARIPSRQFFPEKPYGADAKSNRR
jgi:hypothetical protein